MFLKYGEIDFLHLDVLLLSSYNLEGTGATDDNSLYC